MQLQTTVKDGEDSNTQTDKFKVSFTPVTDEPKLQLTDLYIQEDTRSQFDIFPQTTDVDGSEQVTRIELSDIPDGVTFYIKNADDSFTKVDYDNSHSHTFIIDDSGAAPGSITTDQLKNLHIQAPPESNKDFTVTVTPTVQDPGADNSETITAEVKVYVKGDADTPLAEHPDIDKITGSEPQTGEAGLIDISSLIGKSGETASGQAAADDSSETLSYILHDLPKEFAPTDADGKITGDFITASDGKVTWSFTHEQMENLHIKVPTHYSGTLSDLKLETIAVEDDGDTAKAERTFDLEIDSVVSTTDPVTHNYTAKEPVTLHPDNSGPGSDPNPVADTVVPLVFTNTADNETVTKVEISSVPSGVMLGILKEDGSITEASASGGVYTFSDNIDNIVAIIEGDGGLTHSVDPIQIGGIKVTVADERDDALGGQTATKELSVDPITITVEGQADQPYIAAVNVTEANDAVFYNTVNVSTEFPDKDGSEDHYYIITTNEEVLLNKGVYQGGGTWYLTADQVDDGFQAWVAGSGRTEELTVTAYAAENTIQSNSTTVTIKGYDGDDGTENIRAQVPTLEVVDPQPVEDNTFTLADVVVESGTHNQDSDNGNETLSFVIKNLDLSAGHIESIKGVTQYSYLEEGVTKTAYRIDVPGTEPDAAAIEEALEQVIITPEANYSGDITFTLEAIANEPTASAGQQFAVTSQPVTITVQPQAEETLTATATGELAAAVEEDHITPVTLQLSNEDTSNPESFSNIRLSLDTGNGRFVDASGNTLGDGTSLNGLNYDPATGILSTGDNTQVHYQPPQDKGGTFSIEVIADMTDGGDTTEAASATIDVEVTPIPDGGDFVLWDKDENPVDADHDLKVVEDGKVKLNIHANSFQDSDDSEFQTILIKNVPAGMLFYNGSDELVGEINDTADSGNTWKLPASVLDGNLFIQPPLHYTGDIQLTVKGVAMEQDNMGSFRRQPKGRRTCQ